MVMPRDIPASALAFPNPPTASDAMGQAYQIIGQFIAALDDPECVPSEAEQIRVLDYLAAGVYDEEFLPWPKP